MLNKKARTNRKTTGYKVVRIAQGKTHGNEKKDGKKVLTVVVLERWGFVSYFPIFWNIIIS